MSIFEHSSKFVVISKKLKISIKSFSYYADNNSATFYRLNYCESRAIEGDDCNIKKY